MPGEKKVLNWLLFSIGGMSPRPFFRRSSSFCVLSWAGKRRGVSGTKLSVDNTLERWKEGLGQVLRRSLLLASFLCSKKTSTAPDFP